MGKVHDYVAARPTTFNEPCSFNESSFFGSHKSRVSLKRNSRSLDQLDCISPSISFPEQLTLDRNSPVIQELVAQLNEIEISITQTREKLSQLNIGLLIPSMDTLNIDIPAKLERKAALLDQLDEFHIRNLGGLRHELCNLSPHITKTDKEIYQTQVNQYRQQAAILQKEVDQFVANININQIRLEALTASQVRADKIVELLKNKLISNNAHKVWQKQVSYKAFGGGRQVVIPALNSSATTVKYKVPTGIAKMIEVLQSSSSSEQKVAEIIRIAQERSKVSPHRGCGLFKVREDVTNSFYRALSRFNSEQDSIDQLTAHLTHAMEGKAVGSIGSSVANQPLPNSLSYVVM